MLAYIGNFVKSLSLTFLTEPRHFCKASYDGDAQKKTKRQTIPTLHKCTFCLIQGGGQDGEQNSTYVYCRARLSEKNLWASWPLSFHFWSPGQVF